MSVCVCVCGYDANLRVRHARTHRHNGVCVSECECECDVCYWQIKTSFQQQIVAANSLYYWMLMFINVNWRWPIFSRLFSFLSTNFFRFDKGFTPLKNRQMKMLPSTQTMIKKPANFLKWNEIELFEFKLTWWSWLFFGTQRLIPVHLNDFNPIKANRYLEIHLKGNNFWNKIEFSKFQSPNRIFSFLFELNKCVYSMGCSYLGIHGKWFLRSSNETHDFFMLCNRDCWISDGEREKFHENWVESVDSVWYTLFPLVHPFVIGLVENLNWLKSTYWFEWIFDVCECVKMKRRKKSFCFLFETHTQRASKRTAMWMFTIILSQCQLRFDSERCE